MARKRSRREGQREEDLVLEMLRQSIPDLYPTTNSGATFGNQDLGTARWLVEVKSTIHRSLPLKLDLLEQLRDKGYRLCKEPLLAVVLDRGELRAENVFLVISPSLLHALLRGDLSSSSSSSP